jgi:hypothetical protein
MDRLSLGRRVVPALLAGALAALCAYSQNPNLRDLIYGQGGKAPAAPKAQAPRANAPQAAQPRPAAGGGVVPPWVTPGMRLTYEVMTGSLSVSLNGFDPDDAGEWENKQTRQRFSKDRLGHSSHGLVQPTVAGLDGQGAALAQPFYLFDGQSQVPIFNSALDSLVTLDSGGDYWMHPAKQAALRQSGQARAGSWRVGGQTVPATIVVQRGAVTKTFWAYDQQTGRQLYLSRLSRYGPAIRDHSTTLPDSVSHATFLRFVSARQLNLPWLQAPLPQWAQNLRMLSYRGQMTLQFPGSVPGSGQGLAQTLQVARRGQNWMMFSVNSQLVGMPTDTGDPKAANGPGCLPPLIIAPEVLARLRPGQELDRDPHTQIVVRVAGADAQMVALQSDGPRMSTSYFYDRAQGLMIRRISRETVTSGQQMTRVKEMQLAGRQ